MIYCHPKHDAAVSITRLGDVLQLDFLAKGRSQIRSGGEVVGYKQRNPNRRELVGHLLGAIHASFPKCAMVAAQGGKKGAGLDLMDGRMLNDGDAYAAVRASYSKAGNYRWRLWVKLEGVEPDDFAARLKLKRADTHRPVESSWPRSIKKLASALVVLMLAA